jgi:hypothetical protein
VLTAPNAVLHPWLQQEWTAILADLATQPPLPDTVAPRRASRAFWEQWQDGLTAPLPLPAALPPLRALLVWDTLAGHKTPEMVDWLIAHGVLPLYTPLGGSWLNMAESIQRIITRRALVGQHPQDAQEVMDWLAATTRPSWNAAPTPFVWGGQRQQRRWRARQRRHALGGSGAVTYRPLPRRQRSPFERLCA